MKEFRSRPLDDFIMKAEWGELYVLAEHWKSDLIFYRNDLKILYHLAEKYLLWQTRDEEVQMVERIQKKLRTMENRCDRLLERVQKHLTHLSDLMENPFPQDDRKFRAEHDTLENRISDFLKAFRDTKKETFTITEHLMEAAEMAKGL